jgi:hypothetical protein
VGLGVGVGFVVGRWSIFWIKGKSGMEGGYGAGKEAMFRKNCCGLIA